jgi:hypothetical protein
VYSASAGERLLQLDTDISATGYLYIDPGSGTRVVGNGAVIDATEGSLYAVTLDHVFMSVEIADPGQSLWMDSVTFTGMTGETAPQLRYTHPGDPCASCYTYHAVHFDPTSAGAYIEAIDPVADGNALVLYMERNPGDGPARTVTAGGAQVHWSDVPYYLYLGGGDGQAGPSHQPLPDSLTVRVSDFADLPVSGVAVDWAVIAGDGSVNPTTSTSAADGFARTQFTVGDTMFLSHTVMATSASLPADTVYFNGYPSGAPSGVAANGVLRERSRATYSPRAGELERRRTAEPMRRPSTARPERPAAGPDRTSDGDRP